MRLFQNPYQEFVTPNSQNSIPAGTGIPSMTIRLIPQFCWSHLHFILHHGPESVGFNTEQDLMLFSKPHSICFVNINFLNMAQVSMFLMFMVMYTSSLPSLTQSDLMMKLRIQSEVVGEGILVQDDVLPSAI